MTDRLEQGSQAEMPSVSIVIPCRNEEAFIGSCLESVTQMEYPKDRLEILVVDGMSQDRTPEILRTYANGHPHIILLQNPKKIVPAAMNIGIRRAGGEFIIRLDAHSSYPRHYVTTCIRHLRRTGADIVGGWVRTTPGAETLMAESIALATSHPFGVGNSSFRTSSKGGFVDTVPFGAYRRDLVDKVGLYDERLPRNQDNELCSRVLQHGGKIYLASDLEIRYFNQATLSGLLSQASRTGMWNVMTLRINPRAFRWRHFIPFCFVTGLAASFLLPLTAPWLRYSFLGVLGPYAVVTCFCSMLISTKAGLKHLLVLPWLFFLYHACYGLGTCWGLILSLAGQWKLSEE
ncbi:glycosyltransferase family 2 protein [Elusimicrobiota bacterium]